jgi:hypothetical protein
MNKIILVTVCIMSMVVYAGEAQLSVAGEPPERVVICHIPPDDPINFHTITVSEKSLPAHLGHYDILGPCDNYCEQLCDDDNPCTVDSCLDDRGGCTPIDEREPVDCNDLIDCTDDSCDEFTGCMNIADDTNCPVAHYCDPINGCSMTECPCYGETKLNNWFTKLIDCEGEVNCSYNTQNGFIFILEFIGQCPLTKRHLMLIHYSAPGGTFCLMWKPKYNNWEQTYVTDEQVIACREILFMSNLWSLCP